MTKEEYKQKRKALKIKRDRVLKTLSTNWQEDRERVWKEYYAEIAKLKEETK